jgi:hypothetical protein
MVSTLTILRGVQIETIETMGIVSANHNRILVRQDYKDILAMIKEGYWGVGPWGSLSPVNRM